MAKSLEQTVTELADREAIRELPLALLRLRMAWRC